MSLKILADGRWRGTHGIGRFTSEVLSRLNSIDILNEGPSPLSAKNFFWLPRYLRSHSLYFNPGFNPILNSPIPFVFTIHDLTHLFFPGKNAFIKKMYYETLMKGSAKKAFHIFTVSEFSKKTIIDWAKIPSEKITVVGNGVSAAFKKEGATYSPGFRYLLYVGNAKAHKNIFNLLKAFAAAKIDSAFRLILTCENTFEISSVIAQNNLSQRVIFANHLSDEELASYYRGATALIFPSFYEGFGIPLIKAMACGTPIVTSNVTSLPEVAGNAALFVEPDKIDSIANGIEQITSNETLRNDLIQKGFVRAQDFSWDRTAGIINHFFTKLK